MKYAIYGANRVAKDFMYIFEDIEVMYLFDDIKKNQIFADKNVFPIDMVKEKKADFQQIIICDFDKKEKIEKLKSIGLEYNKDYILEEDLFINLDKESYFQAKEKKTVVWGTGKRARQFDHIMKERYEIQFYIDTNKSQDRFSGKRVLRPDEINNWNELFIIVAVADDYEIINVLKQHNLIAKRDFCSSMDIILQPSNMLRRTIFDQSHYNLKCETMLNHIEMLTKGAIYCCCVTFMENGIGKVPEQGLQEIWESTIHKIMCLSLENRTYTFCKKDICPLFINKKNDMDSSETIRRPYKVMKKHPDTAIIGFDSSCNLKCETCRNKLHYAKGDELKKVKGYAEIVRKDLFPYVDFLIMAGDGEVFAGRGYKEVYTHPGMERIKWIRLLSNGTLFNHKTWANFSKNKSQKIMLTLSIDAASKETYETIRRNGNFDVLTENLNFVSELRKAGEISYFRMNFVVQKKNYLEMIPFTEWGIELGADEVFFTKILNWGTYTEEEFREISMMKEDGITPKKELQKILDNPIMREKIVDLGTIRYAHDSCEIGTVENYYRWELERKIPDLFKQLEAEK